MSKRSWLYKLGIVLIALVVAATIVHWTLQGSSRGARMGIADPDLVWESPQIQASQLANSPHIV